MNLRDIIEIDITTCCSDLGQKILHLVYKGMLVEGWEAGRYLSLNLNLVRDLVRRLSEKTKYVIYI